MKTKLENQTVLIIGGSQGIGLATAQAAQALGAQVMIASRSQENLRQAKEQLGAVETYVLDASKEEDVKHFFQESPPFDHLVITAAGAAAGAFRDLDLQTVRALYDSKLWLQLNAVKWSLDKLSPTGSITLFSGIVSRKAMPGQLPYTGIAGAIESMGRMLANELAPIRVNVVTPGFIDTPVWRQFMPEESVQSFFEDFGPKLPARRVGKPEDVALGVMYLIQNGFSTGTVLDIDGGHKVM